MFDGRDDHETAALERKHDALGFCIILDGNRKIEISRESRLCPD
jgi:hypothetical protein